MALDNIKEKLKKPFHRSKNRDSSGPGSSRLSHEHHAQSTAIPPRPKAAIAPASTYTSSRQSSVSSLKESSLDRAAAPGLHNTEYKLPQVPRQSDFSSDFTGLTFSSQQAGYNDRHGIGGQTPMHLNEGRNSENIADRNITTSTHDVASTRGIPQPEHELRSQPLIPNVDPHASNVADWNIVKNDNVAAGSQYGAPQPLNVQKRRSAQYGSEAVSRKPLPHDRDDIREPSWSVTPLAMEGSDDKSPLDARGRISNLNREMPIVSDTHLAPRRSSLDQPLPLTPPAAMSRDRDLSANGNAFGDASEDNGVLSAPPNLDSTGPFNLDGVAVKQEPETVSLHEYQAPAVTHETIKEERREVRQKVITLETHDY
ncbi:hypothetical protein E2P81_ATG10179, partial [Venturia nashicola]